MKVSHNYLEVIVTLDLGPRIISFRNTERNNILYEDIEREVVEEGDFFDKTYGQGEKWYLYGGHRLWSSPQDWFSYYPDNNPVKYEIKENKIVFIPLEQKVTNLKFEMTLEFTQSDKLKIDHKITNKGEEEKTLASWGITALRGSGMQIVPMPKYDAGFLASRFISFWDIGATMNDNRIFFGDKYFTTKHVPGNTELFKIGFNVIDGYAMYLLENDIFIKEFPYDETETYPDNNINFETFLSDKITELETMSGLKTISKDEFVEHTEYWSLLDNDHEIPAKDDEKRLEELVNYYLAKTNN